MPGGDRTGPVARNPSSRGRGTGGMGRGAGFAGPGGECQCPNCGYRETHQKGIPCNTKKCPKCNTPMIRA
jgi:hypothetical protein